MLAFLHMSKYQSAKNIEKLIINAVECEPYITADHQMVSTHLEELLLGTRVMKRMAGAEEALIAIKVSHPKADRAGAPRLAQT